MHAWVACVLWESHLEWRGETSLFINKTLLTFIAQVLECTGVFNESFCAMWYAGILSNSGEYSMRRSNKKVFVGNICTYIIFFLWILVSLKGCISIFFGVLFCINFLFLVDTFIQCVNIYCGVYETTRRVLYLFSPLFINGSTFPAYQSLFYSSR